MEPNFRGLDEDESLLASYTTSKLRIYSKRLTKPIKIFTKIVLKTIILTTCNSTSLTLMRRPVPLRGRPTHASSALMITRRFQVTGDRMPQYLTAEYNSSV